MLIPFRPLLAAIPAITLFCFPVQAQYDDSPATRLAYNTCYFMSRGKNFSESMNFAMKPRLGISKVSTSTSESQERKPGLESTIVGSEGGTMDISGAASAFSQKSSMDSTSSGYIFNDPLVPTPLRVLQNVDFLYSYSKKKVNISKKEYFRSIINTCKGRLSRAEYNSILEGLK